MIAKYIRDNLNGDIPDRYKDPYGQGRIVIKAPETTIPAITTTTTSTAQTTTTTTTTTTIVSTTAQALIPGDANGDGKVNVRDAAFIAMKLAQGKVSELPQSADYNKDGEINVRDAAAIAQFLATRRT